LGFGEVTLKEGKLAKGRKFPKGLVGIGGYIGWGSWVFIYTQVLI